MGEGQAGGKELKNLIKELKADTVEKDTRLDHLQKRSEKLYSSLGKVKEETIREFRASSVFSQLLDKNLPQVLKTFAWTLLNPFQGWILTPSSFPPWLKVLYSRRALRT